VSVACDGANNLVGEREMAELRRLYRPTASQRWARLAGKEAAHSALLLQLELPLEPMVVAADEAHAAGVHVCLRASPLNDSRLSEVRELVGHVDVLFVGESEAPRLLSWGSSGLATLDEAR